MEASIKSMKQKLQSGSFKLINDRNDTKQHSVMEHLSQTNLTTVDDSRLARGELQWHSMGSANPHKNKCSEVCAILVIYHANQI